MNPHRIRKWCRAIGLLLGAGGMIAVAMCLILPWPSTESIITFSRWLPVFLLLLLASFLFRAAYLTWFRWSPLALRHVINAVFFFVTLAWMYSMLFLLPQVWGFFACVVGVFVWYTIYQTVAYLMIRNVFPRTLEAPGASPSSVPHP